VKDQNAPLYAGGQRQDVEETVAHLPQQDPCLLAQPTDTLCFESEERIDSAAFVVSPYKIHTPRVSDFDGKKEQNNVARARPAIDEVTIENVINKVDIYGDTR